MALENEDILHHVFSYMDCRGLYKCLCVCKKWRRVLTENPGALLAEYVFSKSLLDPGQRLDIASKPWRILATPMVQMGESPEWEYGYSLCRKPKASPAKRDVPYCTVAAQQTIHRQNAANLLSTTQPAGVDRPDMPRLHLRHRMICPAYVTGIDVVAVMAIHFDNYKAIWLNEDLKVRLQEIPHVIEKENACGRHFTIVGIRMNHRHDSPTRNVVEMLDIMGDVTDGVPKFLMNSLRMNIRTYLPKLPKSARHPRVKFDESASLVHMVAISKRVAKKKLEECYERLDEEIQWTLRAWGVSGVPWGLFNYNMAVCVAMTWCTSETPLNGAAITRHCVRELQKSEFNCHYRNMVRMGYDGGTVRLNPEVLATIIAVLLYYNNREVDYGFNPFYKSLREQEMGRLEGAIKNGNFILGRTRVPLDSIAGTATKFMWIIAEQLENTP